MVALTILLTVYGQLVMKWQSNLAGAPPAEMAARVEWIIAFLLRPFVISCFAAAFAAAITWILVLHRFNLSWAYPFMSLTFPLVVFGSALFFHEPLTVLKVAGVALIILGVSLQAIG